MVSYKDPECVYDDEELIYYYLTLSQVLETDTAFDKLRPRQLAHVKCVRPSRLTAA